jgi:RNA polymerase sigma-70 factor (ECF subfamily)
MEDSVPALEDSEATKQLLDRVQAGDRAAFGELFERHRRRLRKAVRWRLDRRLCKRVDESDIVQETQLVAFRRLGDYLARQPMPFGLWLRKTAQERISNHRRAHVDTSQRTVTREQPLPNQSSMLIAAPFVDRGPSPSQCYTAQEYRRLVGQAVDELSEQDREILLMRNVEGLTHPEIAQILDATHEAVRKRYGRALMKLQQLLEQRGLAEGDYD